MLWLCGINKNGHQGRSCNSQAHMLSEQSKHISVCICTFKRLPLLQRLLQALEEQETDGLFSFSIVVADNDGARSAETLVAGFARKATIAITYCVQPQQNISLTRNKAIENATGDYIAFIDDDEFPIKRWLVNLLKALDEYKVDGVLGPVKRCFDQPPPKWVLDGNFYERATYATGLVIDWRKGRTGNVLLKRDLFAGDASPFRPEFRQGEDQDFFHRMIENGHRFIWCNEAVAYEVVPPIRWNRRFMLRRALLRGAMEPKTPGFGARSILKSLVAVPTYLVVLPFAALAGHHKFMMMLVSLCDHLGKLFAVMGLNPVKEQYVTE
jgi:succinoglycan biosynthesis protein ExoM